MSLKPFYYFFPELAKQETRCITILDEGEGLPPGKYAFAESYCYDPDCDCRRVMLNVYCEETKQPLAAISFGFNADDDMRGPFLDPLNRQSEHANQLLDLARNLLLSDAAYVARLERHYRMVKDIDRARQDVPWWKRKKKKPKRV